MRCGNGFVAIEFRPDVADEEVGKAVLFAAGSGKWIVAEEFLRARKSRSEFRDLKIPFGIAALMLEGILDLWPPAFLVFLNAILREEVGAFSIVFRTRGAIGGFFRRQRRVDVTLVGGVKEGVQSVVLTLRNGIEFVVVTLGASGWTAGALVAGSRPSQVVATVFARFTICSKRASARSTPASRFVKVLRRNPVAMV